MTDPARQSKFPGVAVVDKNLNPIGSNNPHTRLDIDLFDLDTSLDVVLKQRFFYSS